MAKPRGRGLNREEIDRIKEAVPVELFVAYLGADTREGYRGKTKVVCPFHDDTHASAVIFPDGVQYYCSTCGAQGDIYALVQLAGLAKDFNGALTWLKEHAQDLGVEVPNES